MKSALQFLIDKEWTMGNGQCDECHGLGESFVFGVTEQSEEWGHELNCGLAQCITELGGSPFYKKEFILRPYSSKSRELFYCGLARVFRQNMIKAIKKNMEKIK